MQATAKSYESNKASKRQNGNLPQRQFKAAILFGLILLWGIAFVGVSFFEVPTERYTFMATSALNVLVFIAITIQALIYHRQWAVMNETLAETRKTAEAATTSVGIANASIQLLERPHISLDRVTISRPTEQKFWTVIACFRNSGKTNAVNVRIGIDARWSQDHAVTGVEFTHLRSRALGPYVIVPGGEIRLPIDVLGHPMTHSEFVDSQNMGETKPYLLVYGSFSYRDTINEPPIERIENYGARYITWATPRPDMDDFVDFWIFNGLGDGVDFQTLR